MMFKDGSCGRFFETAFYNYKDLFGGNIIKLIFFFGLTHQYSLINFFASLDWNFK